MLGAYSTAMGTRFNGFGETEIVECTDAPWATLFVELAPVRVAVPAAAERNVVPMVRKPRKPRLQAR